MGVVVPGLREGSEGERDGVPASAHGDAPLPAGAGSREAEGGATVLAGSEMWDQREPWILALQDHDCEVSVAGGIEEVGQRRAKPRP